MTTIPFLGGAEGNPTKLHSAIVGQPTKGIPPLATASWRDFRDYGGGPTLSQNRYARLAFSPTGNPLTPLVGKLVSAAGQKSLGDVDPADYGFLHLCANLFGGRYTHTNPGAAGIHQWQFDGNQGLDANLALLALQHYTDVLPAHIFFDAQCGGLQLSAQPDSNLQAQFNVGAGQFLLADDAVIETAVGTPTLPLVRGIWGQQVTDADDGDLWIKLVTDDGGGAYTVQAALGSSTVEPTWSSSQSGVVGTWLRPIDSVTSLYIGGSLGTSIQILFPTGATLEAGSVFRIPTRRANWPDTLGASRAISSIDSVFIQDGAEIPLHGGSWEINSAWSTFEVLPDVHGRQGHFVDRRGVLNTTVTPTRRIEDMTNQSAILRLSDISLVVRAETQEVISGEVEPYQIILLFPSLSIGGDIYTTGIGADTANESPVMTAGEPSSTFNYTDERGNTFSTDQAFSIIVRNDKSAV